MMMIMIIIVLGTRMTIARGEELGKDSGSLLVVAACCCLVI